jgi:hypothetical protein
MKKLFLLIPILIFSSQTCSDNKKDNVEQLFQLMKTDSIVEQIYTQTNQVLENMGQQMGVKESEQEGFQKHLQEMMTLIKQEVNWEKMKEPMIAIYLEHYSEKEIKDMIAFYKTETGQSMIKKMPMVMQDSMQLSQKIMQDLSPKLIELMDKYQLEHNQKGGHTH